MRHDLRKGQEGTWITEDMLAAYIALHEAGHAHSVEVWEGNEIIGGLYGVVYGKIFSGESMFALKSNASKIAFVHLAQKLGNINLNGLIASKTRRTCKAWVEN